LSTVGLVIYVLLDDSKTKTPKEKNQENEEKIKEIKNKITNNSFNKNNEKKFF
jgi:hypothetical protein